MADETEKTEDKKADADEGVTLDKLLSAVDGLCKRMDAMEAGDKKADADDDKKEGEAEKKADADETDDKGKPKEVAADKKADDDDMAAADKARKDAEDEAEKAKADALAKADSDQLRQRLADVERMLPKQLSDADHTALADAQARADKVFQAFGDSAPRPLNGEDLNGYRRRLAAGLKSHSPRLKDVDVRALADTAAFEVMEGMIYADALQAAHNPADLPDGHLREIKDRDVTGRVVSTFAGQPRAWMSQFGGQSQRLTKINQPQTTH